MRKHTEGAALIITVWLIALASVLAMNYSSAVRNDIKISASGLARAQARAAAEAGFWRAAYELESPRPEQPWPVDGTAVAFDFGGASVSIRTQDLRGLADLNTTPGENLQTIIAYALQDPERATEITARIVDWRDRDDDTAVSGAEDDDYAAANLNYGAKDGPFNTREDLQLVLGVTPAEYEAIAPFVTVHSQRPSIDLTVAPSYISQALMDPAAGSTTAVIEPIPGRNPGAGADRSQGRRGTSFEILVQADVNGVIRRLAAAVEIYPGRRNGLRVAILAWRETWPYRIPKENTEDNAAAG